MLWIPKLADGIVMKMVCYSETVDLFSGPVTPMTIKLSPCECLELVTWWFSLGVLGYTLVELTAPLGERSNAENTQLACLNMRQSVRLDLCVRQFF